MHIIENIKFWHEWLLPITVKPAIVLLQWRHNGRDSVSNHQSHDCLFRRRLKKTPKLRVTGLCEGNSPVTGEFPAQMASNVENVSIWWRHHALSLSWRIIRSTFPLLLSTQSVLYNQQGFHSFSYPVLSCDFYSGHLGNDLEIHIRLLVPLSLARKCFYCIWLCILF